MPRFVIQKLPPLWRFVPSKRQVRNFLARLNADVRLVEFVGTGWSGSASDRLSLGFVESRVVESRWCFYLRLWGVREAAVGGLRNELAGVALGEMECYIRGRRALPPDVTIKPTQLYLPFRVVNGSIQSACREKAKDRRAFPSGEWWEEGTPKLKDSDRGLS